MADLFISYSRQDSARVARLETALRQLGVDTWRDLEMPIGHPAVDSEVLSQLAQCRALLVCWSRASVHSNAVEGERRTMEEAGKPILGVMLDPPKEVFEQAPFRRVALERQNSADLSEWDGGWDDPAHEGDPRDNFLRLLEAVGKAIGGENGPRIARMRADWLQRKRSKEAEEQARQRLEQSQRNQIADAIGKIAQEVRRQEQAKTEAQAKARQQRAPRILLLQPRIAGALGAASVATLTAFRVDYFGYRAWFDFPYVSYRSAIFTLYAIAIVLVVTGATGLMFADWEVQNKKKWEDGEIGGACWAYWGLYLPLGFGIAIIVSYLGIPFFLFELIAWLLLSLVGLFFDFQLWERSF